MHSWTRGSSNGSNANRSKTNGSNAPRLEQEVEVLKQVGYPVLGAVCQLVRGKNS